MKPDEIKKLCRENNIDLLVLFGSEATKATHAGSDMDLAVLLKRGSRTSKLKLIGELDDCFGGKKIDLVILTTETDPLLLHEIFSHGRTLYERRKGIFINQKLRAWKLYIDTGKIRRMNEKYLKAFSRKVVHVA
jgi:predicted nucleotidyltransferase